MDAMNGDSAKPTPAPAPPIAPPTAPSAPKPPIDRPACEAAFPSAMPPPPLPPVFIFAMRSAVARTLRSAAFSGASMPVVLTVSGMLTFGMR